MSKTFINGMLAEKAKQAQALISELLAEMPDAMLEQHQQVLSAAARNLQDIHHDLRKRDGK
jgi:hypothetical protein